jgi:hypothetical protein
MYSHKDKPIIANRRTAPRPGTDRSTSPKFDQALGALGDELTVIDESDFGTDPYNTTGQLVILKSKLGVDD